MYVFGTPVKNEKNSKWEFVPVFVLGQEEGKSAQAMEVLTRGNKYYRFRGEAFNFSYQRFLFSDPFFFAKEGGVIASFSNNSSNWVFKGIVAPSSYSLKGKIYVNTGDSFYIVVKSAVRPYVSTDTKKAMATFNSELSNMVPYIAAVYMAVVHNSEPVSIPLGLSLNDAKFLAKLLSLDGCIAVINDENGEEVMSFGAFESQEVEETEEEDIAVEEEYFYINPILKDGANILAAMASAENFHHTSMIVSGPSGYGKTAFTTQVARKLGWDVVQIDMSTILETEQLLGNRELRDGNTTFELSTFVKAVTQGKTIVVLDEINRTYAGALNSLFPLLDWRGETTIHGQKITVAPHTIFIATRNVGVGYVGTQQSDTALVSRFDLAVIVDSIPVAEEEKLLIKRTGVSPVAARSIIKTAELVRQAPQLGVNVSPRNTLAIAKLVALGAPVRSAYHLNVLMKVEDPDVRAEVEGILNRGAGSDYQSAQLTSKVGCIF